LINTLYLELKKKHEFITLDLVNILLDKFIKKTYKITIDKQSNLDFTGLRNYENLFEQCKIPKKYKKLQDHFTKLLATPQPEQRTKAWFDYRHLRITASDTAEAIDLNPYQPVESFILKKCDPAHKFDDNQNVYHGKKYEPIATMLYEHIYNIRVTEFGALPSETYPILGASPDGICSAYTLDNKFSEMLGRMLEIKCTVTRHLYTSGIIPGHICPFYYYCQVQQQLECCDLEECDFWQCKIIEYNNREEYLLDVNEYDANTIGINNEKMKVNKILKKGLILKFLPKNFIPDTSTDPTWEDNIEWKGKFIYPPRLDMSVDEYNEWAMNILSKERVGIDDCYFDKIVYWKLEQSHNVTIVRDRKFFSNILPILNETWKQVEYYRQHLDELDELREIIKIRTKRNYINTKFKINNTENKLFL
jgi:putative phage-type endonuclease